LKNALIFGLTGQDGSYLSDFLLKKGYNVFGTFRRTSHKCFERLEEMDNLYKVTRIKADLSDSTSIQAAIKESQPDEVYNLAAQSFVGASFQQPILTADITGLGTLRVLEAVRENAPMRISMANIILPRMIEVIAMPIEIIPTAQNQSELLSLCSYS